MSRGSSFFEGVIWVKHTDNNDPIIRQQNDPETKASREVIRLLTVCHLLLLFHSFLHQDGGKKSEACVDKEISGFQQRLGA